MRSARRRSRLRPDLLNPLAQAQLATRQAGDRPSGPARRTLPRPLPAHRRMPRLGPACRASRRRLASRRALGRRLAGRRAILRPGPECSALRRGGLPPDPRRPAIDLPAQCVHPRSTHTAPHSMGCKQQRGLGAAACLQPAQPCWAPNPHCIKRPRLSPTGWGRGLRGQEERGARAEFGGAGHPRHARVFSAFFRTFAGTVAFSHSENGTVPFPPTRGALMTRVCIGFLGKAHRGTSPASRRHARRGASLAEGHLSPEPAVTPQEPGGERLVLTGLVRVQYPRADGRSNVPAGDPPESAGGSVCTSLDAIADSALTGHSPARLAAPSQDHTKRVSVLVQPQASTRPSAHPRQVRRSLSRRVQIVEAVGLDPVGPAPV